MTTSMTTSNEKMTTSGKMTTYDNLFLYIADVHNYKISLFNRIKVVMVVIVVIDPFLMYFYIPFDNSYDVLCSVSL